MSEIIQKYEAQLQANPANHLARFSLAKALFDLERFAEAEGHFTKAVEARADWMAAWILFGKCQLAGGNKPAARKTFELARKLAVEQNHQGPLEEVDQLLAELED